MHIVNRNNIVLYTYEGMLRDHNYDSLNLEGAIFEGANLVNVIFYYTNLEGAIFKYADLYWAVLCWANLKGADFEGANLRGADMQGAICKGANFKNADLSLDNLGGSTQLQDACFLMANFDGAKLQGAHYNKGTVFPEGFDPNSQDLILVDK